jgi:carbonic anhydrase
MSEIERFVRGFQRFRQQYFDRQPELFRELKEGQHPGTLLIGCCDSRTDPAHLLGCDPGDIFTVRNVANLVPPCDPKQHFAGVSSAIQFAVQRNKPCLGGTRDFLDLQLETPTHVLGKIRPRRRFIS